MNLTYDRCNQFMTMSGGVPSFVYRNITVRNTAIFARNTLNGTSLGNWTYVVVQGTVALADTTVTATYNSSTKVFALGLVYSAGTTLVNSSLVYQDVVCPDNGNSRYAILIHFMVARS